MNWCHRGSDVLYNAVLARFFCVGQILCGVHLSLPLIIKTMNSCRVLCLNRVWSSPRTPIHALLIICCRAERREREGGTSDIWVGALQPDLRCYANIVCCYIRNMRALSKTGSCVSVWIYMRSATVISPTFTRSQIWLRCLWGCGFFSSNKWLFSWQELPRYFSPSFWLNASENVG